MMIGCLGSMGIMLSKLPEFGWNEVFVLFIIAIIIFVDFFPSILPILKDGFLQDTEYSDFDKKRINYLSKITPIFLFIYYLFKTFPLNNLI